MEVSTGGDLRPTMTIKFGLRQEFQVEYRLVDGEDRVESRYLREDGSPLCDWALRGNDGPNADLLVHIAAVLRVFAGRYVRGTDRLIDRVDQV